MNKQQVVELLLACMSTLLWSVGGGNGMVAVSGLQPGINKAAESWFRDNDPRAIREMATTLNTLGGLTETEYQQIMDVIDGEISNGIKHN